MKLFVGLDVSKTKLDVCFLARDDDHNTVLYQTTVGNSDAGASHIKQSILQFHEELSFDKIVVGMEATGLYSTLPSLYFSQDPDLQLINVQTVVENPRVIHRFSKVWTDEKNDRLDAQLIAEFLSTGKYNVALPRNDQYVALLRLTRARYQLVHQMTEAQQHYVENLYYKCNTLTTELKNENISTSVFSSTMVQLMTGDITMSSIHSMETEALANLLQKYGRQRFKDPEKLAMVIKKSIRDSYRLGRVAQDSIDINLGIQMRIIRAFEQEIKTIDKAIKDIMEALPEATCLMSIPGIGPVYAAGILAEILSLIHI